MSEGFVRCLGLDDQGRPCICICCTKTHEDDAGRILCSNCGHIESAHPTPTPAPPAPVASIIKEYRDLGRFGAGLSATSSSSNSKATQREAEAETNNGLKKRKKSATDTEPATKGKSNKPEQKRSKGSSGDLTLTYTKAPSQTDINLLWKYKLAAMSTPDKPLSINTCWNTDRCDRFFRSLFPELFSHLDRHPPKADPTASQEVQQQQWLAVIKQKQAVALAQDQLPTGAELATYARRKGHSASERILFIATKIAVSADRYKDWNLDSDSDEPEEEEDSNYDMLDSDDSPRKTAPVAKGKAKARALSPAFAVKLEKPDPVPQSDMKQAALMRTRLSTKSIKKKKFIIPNSSDDGQPEIIELSDEDSELPDPSTLVASLSPKSAISAAFTSPLFTSFAKSPSPEDPFPDPFEDADLFAPSPTENISGPSSGWASTSSLVSSTSQAQSASDLPSFFSLMPPPPPASSTPFAASSSSLLSSSLPSATSTGETSSISLASNRSSGSSVAGPFRPSVFLKRGKGLTNPWKR
ncbi:hypothetical protein FB451DRAFT_1165922 [Mycena latifolia]|nr:hypothetical protein FB451DRAFT_1165922 [Mycena latifolia]